MLSARVSFSLVALVAVAAALTQARAAPLDADTCAKLQAEQTQLEGAGVDKDMAKGPDWAKANLGLEKLQRVQRFIEIEEQLLFRCRSKAIVQLVPEHEPGATADQDDDKDGKDDNDDNKKDSKGTVPKAGAAQAKGADPKQKQQPDAGKKAAPQPAAKPTAAPRKQSPAKAPPPQAAVREPAGEGVTSIEKRPPKAKVDDAYKVPPPDPSVNPFANQFTPPAAK